MTKEEFFKRYNKWKEEQMEKLTVEKKTGHCEVCEDGSVYLGNLTWFPKGTVTPWKEWDRIHYLHN